MNFRDTDPMMVLPRSVWLATVTRGIQQDMSAKFLNGQKEHGSDLGAVPMDTLLKELYMEQLDSLMYLAEIKRRIGNGDDMLISRLLIQKLLTILDRHTGQVQFDDHDTALITLFRKIATNEKFNTIGSGGIPPVGSATASSPDNIGAGAHVSGDGKRP